MAACVVLAEIDWVSWAMWVAFGFTAATFFALVGAARAEHHGRDPLVGAILGALLGPWGWIAIEVIGRRR